MIAKVGTRLTKGMAGEVGLGEESQDGAWLGMVRQAFEGKSFEDKRIMETWCAFLDAFL